MVERWTTAFQEDLKKIQSLDLQDHERQLYNQALFAENRLMAHLAKDDQMEVNEGLYEDLDFFTTDNPVINHLDRTQTIFGSSYLKLLIKTPLANPNHLKARQSILQTLGDQPETTVRLAHHLDQCQALADDLIWFWKPQSPETQHLWDIVYYKPSWLKFLNQSPKALNVTSYLGIYILPLIQVLSPLIPIIAIYFMMRQVDPNLNFGMISEMIGEIYQIRSATRYHLFALIVWGLLYLYGIYSTITNAILQYRVIALLHTKLHQLTVFKNEAKALYRIYQDHCPLDRTIDHNAIQRALAYFDALADLDRPPRLLDNKGHTLSLYEAIRHQEDFKVNLGLLIQFTGYIDCLVSTRALCREGYTWTQYLAEPQRPVIYFGQIWHPCLDRGQAVFNSSLINTHRILTGPNAGGKSTYIKNVAILILLAQTLTLCNAGKSRLTPIKRLHTYIHLVDTKGVESLYEAEMNRAYAFLTQIKALRPHEKVVAIFDELFTSTNIYEGVAAAKTLCEEFISYPNLLTLLTTHYTELTDLERLTGGQFKNFKVSCKRNQGEIIFDYKIRPGISDQFVALDLLKRKGFDPHIIDRALDHLSALKGKA